MLSSPLFKQVTYVSVLVGNGSETVNVYYRIPVTLTQQYLSGRVDLVILRLLHPSTVQCGTQRSSRISHMFVKDSPTCRIPTVPSGLETEWGISAISHSEGSDRP